MATPNKNTLLLALLAAPEQYSKWPIVPSECVGGLLYLLLLATGRVHGQTINILGYNFPLVLVARLCPISWSADGLMSLFGHLRCRVGRLSCREELLETEIEIAQKANIFIILFLMSIVTSVFVYGSAIDIPLWSSSAQCLCWEI